MKVKMSQQGREMVKVLTLSGIFIVLFIQIITHIPMIMTTASEIMEILTPFIIGYCIAFCLIPLERIVECKWLGNDEENFSRKKRIIGVFISVAIMMLIIVGFFAIVIPQIYESVKMLSESIGGYLATAEKWFTTYSTDYPEIQEYLMNFLQTYEQTIIDMIKNVSGYAPKIIYSSYKVLRWILNFFVGLIVTVYILLDKQTFKIQIQKVLYAFAPRKLADATIEVCHITGAMFNQFIFGKAIDSLIVGIICFICCIIFQFPYAPLISVVIGLTNMIPVFGPFLGAIPCIFLLLLINPWKALAFSIFILVLQQIDGNILGPYIIGDSMGLPSLWVMFAIVVGGGLFGILGMFIGVP
ncbi:MAG: AI-2E family transporter, partial [Erysipelotrichaceae bacterium]|nr:AI-2E family transporter [Erysipelotrichaceae bacterium]